MISVEEALQHVRDHARALPVESVPLESACGLRLAEAVVSKVDSPPFDKSMVDGYAISASDTAPTLRILEQVNAGMVPHHAVVPGTTIRVMTGAPVPDGADAVVKWEDTEQIDEDTIRSPAANIESGYCVLHRSTAFHTGQQLLEPGTRLRPIDIGLLAEIGQARVPVVPRPRVAVLPTGNELVDCDESHAKGSHAAGPLAMGQIRNSNGPMLLAALRCRGVEAIDLGIGRDDTEDLRRRIELGLEADVLLVSGGVSAGALDLVPGVLEELGVRQVFHKVNMKPGKPLWFGVSKDGKRDGKRGATLVFGLPGNPVSTLVSFQLFVQPALDALLGEPFAEPSPVRGVLTGPLAHRGGRPSYQPCKLNFGKRRAGLPTVEPLDWHGSADIASLTKSNALAVLAAGDYRLDEGSEVDVMLL